MATAISLIASIVTFMFAGAVLRQCWRHPRVYRFVWAAALLCYGIATSMQFIAEVAGWNTTTFRLWYLCGGLLTAAYLGQGTAFLLLPRRVAMALMVPLLVASVWAALRLATVHLLLSEILPPAGKVSPTALYLPGDLRAAAALLNIYGTLLLMGGALRSAVLYFDRMLDRRRRAGYRLLSNLLIAGGALVVASAGSLETFGHGEYLYIGESAGITIIFMGFLRSNESLHLGLARVRPFKRSGEPATMEAERSIPPTPVRSLRRLSDRVPPPGRQRP